MSGFATAIRFLTRLPLPTGPAREYALGSGVAWFPTVGAVLGVILAAFDLLLRHGFIVPTLLASTLEVVALLALTGALHADGLMDTCDAVFSHASPERRLEIMRDPRVGSFGVAGLVCITAIKIAALDAITNGARVPLLILAPTLGRWSLIASAAAFPYGRPGGSGEPLKAAARPLTVAVASILPVVLATLAGWSGLVAVVLAVAVGLGLGRWLVSLLPGLTGDCYGAICEVTEACVWLGAALALPRLAAQMG